MKKYILLLAITLVSVHTWAQEKQNKDLDKRCIARLGV